MANPMQSPRVVLAGETLSSDRTLRRALVAAGVVCQAVKDGKECLAAVRGDPPDLVFIEIAGSHVDCVEAIRFLRAEESSRHIPVVVVSGEDQEEERMEALDAGATEFLFRPYDLAELRARVAAMMRLLRAEREAAALREEIGRAQLTDAETGVLQRHYIEGRVAAEVKSARRHQHPLSVIFVKFDRPQALPSFDFRPYLRPAADAIKNLVRDEDLVARYASDEFLVVMPHTDSYGSLILAERIRAGVEGLPGVSPRITASVGVASCQRAEDYLKEAPLKRAQAAMMTAESQGGNRVVKQD